MKLWRSLAVHALWRSKCFNCAGQVQGPGRPGRFQRYGALPRRKHLTRGPLSSSLLDRLNSQAHSTPRLLFKRFHELCSFDVPKTEGSERRLEAHMSNRTRWPDGSQSTKGSCLKSIDQLVAAYPRLFHDRHPRIASDLPHGWFDIVDQLCRSISATLDSASAEDFQIAQIKEKFGGLRFYFEFTSAEGPPVGSGNAQVVGRAPLFEPIRALVLEAEDRAGLTCQVCGNPGSRHVIDGWISTRCDAHADAQRNRPLLAESSTQVGSAER